MINKILTFVLLKRLVEGVKHIFCADCLKFPIVCECGTFAWRRCVISLRGREARGPFPLDNTGCERSAAKLRDVTLRHVRSHFQRHPSETHPASTGDRTAPLSPTDPVPWLAPTEHRGRNIIRCERCAASETIELATV